MLSAIGDNRNLSNIIRDYLNYASWNMHQSMRLYVRNYPIYLKRFNKRFHLNDSDWDSILIKIEIATFEGINKMNTIFYSLNQHV